MSRVTLNWLLLILLLLAAAAHFWIDPDPGTPSPPFLPEMVRSIPYDSFSPNPVFADGKTLQAPVAGTIPRELPALPYRATEEDALRAGQDLTNPHPPSDREAAARGALQFRRMCAPCHGPGGGGGGKVVQRGYPPPPSLLSPAALALADGTIFHIISFGKGNMPSHAAQIDREDRWKIISHIRSLQAKAPTADQSR